MKTIIDKLFACFQAVSRKETNKLAQKKSRKNITLKKLIWQFLKNDKN